MGEDKADKGSEVYHLSFGDFIMRKWTFLLANQGSIVVFRPGKIPTSFDRSPFFIAPVCDFTLQCID